MNFHFHISFSDSAGVKDEYYLFCEKLEVFIWDFKCEACELRKNWFWTDSFLKQVTIFNTMTKISKCNQTSLFYLEKKKKKSWIWICF